MKFPGQSTLVRPRSPCHVWLARGVPVPIAGEGIEHLFISATWGALAWTAAACAALLLGLHRFIRGAARHVNPPLFSASDTGYLRPLCWFAISVLQLLTLLPAAARVSSVAMRLLVNLRWWWTAAVIACVAWRIDGRLNGAWRRRLASGWTAVARSPRAAEGALAALAIVWSVWGTPLMRVGGGATGWKANLLFRLTAGSRGMSPAPTVR